MSNPLFLVLGVALLSMALRSFAHPLLHKLGSICVLVTSYLVGYFLTGFWQVGLLCASTWLLLPWFEILTRVRQLRLPADKTLRRRMPPSREVFPALHDLTASLEELGFEQVDDVGLEWEESQQFFRLFYKEDERLQAAVCMIDQGDFGFYYLSFASRGGDGKIWTSWNYPFSHSMKLPPEARLNRVRGDLSVPEMMESHRAFLANARVETKHLVALLPEEIQREIQRDLEAQIAHNLRVGLLLPAADGKVRYSWRGLLFLWVQFLRDFVRFS